MRLYNRLAYTEYDTAAERIEVVYTHKVADKLHILFLSRLLSELDYIGDNSRCYSLCNLKHLVASEAVANENVGAARKGAASLYVADEVKCGLGFKKRVRLLHHLVALSLLNAV